MIELICDRKSGTADDLERELHAEGRPDVVGWVNWTGGRIDADDFGGRVLNSSSRTDKLSQLVRLEMCGVRVPSWNFYGEGEDWYPRTAHHQQGKDFTSPIPAGEIAYYVKRLPLAEEWRLHFFRTTKGNIKLLRSGKKIPKVARPHPWVRSHRLGWKISYIGGAPGDAVYMGREAMAALDLDFGAVDVGMLEVHPLAVVLEVNTCPGLEAGTLARYADEICERFK